MKAFLPILIALLLCPAGLAADGASIAERALEAKIQKQLEAIVGPGKARVTVSGEQSQDKRQQRSRIQTKPQIAAEHKVTETHSQTRNGETTTSTRTESRTSWTHDQTEELSSKAPSGLSRKSVSVIYEPRTRSEDGEESTVPPIDPALIEDIVSSTAGLGDDDRLSVHAVTMDNSAYDRLKEEMERASRETPWWVFALIAAAGLGFGAGIGVLVARSRKPQPEQSDWQVQAGWGSTVQASQPILPVQPLQTGLPAGNAIAAPPQGPVVYLQAGKDAHLG